MGLHVTSADLHNDLLSMYRGNRLADAVRIVGGSRWQQSGATSEQSGSHTVRGIRFRGARWLYWDHDPAAHLRKRCTSGKATSGIYLERQRLPSGERTGESGRVTREAGSSVG
jgi:hypothetical protein